MPVDVGVIGRCFPDLTVDVERGRLRLFAKAIGETDPVYTDLAAARAAGHPDLPVPPTMLFGLELDQPDPYRWLDEIGVDLRHVLHGEQSFTYDALAYAGDRLTLSARVSDAYVKDGGRLSFVVRDTDVRRDATRIAAMRQVIVVRDTGGTS
ncbi:MaoC family dehydratase N-terminal domain-containing protein [Nonomuraea sp. NPDC050536]|uniref:MaoC family dehydratase N-terminal domain-containing protein n=1 Tax=Nonomuraea sp. NPDC050536 TaxID=3364366 RepID=UPI0037CC2C6E